MTFREAAYIVLRNLAGGDISADFNIDEREVIAYIKAAYIELLKNTFKENVKIENDYNIGGQFLTVLTLDVQKDNIRQESYVNLTYSYINLSYGRGVHEVSPIRGNESVYVPLLNGAQKMFEGTPAGHLEGRVGFYPERNQLRFDRCLAVNKVLVKIYTSEDDTIPLDKPETLIRQATDYYLSRKPQDKVNNQNQSITEDSNR